MQKKKKKKIKKKQKKKMIFLFFSITYACEHLGFRDECSNNGICAFDMKTNSFRCFCDFPFIGTSCNATFSLSISSLTTVAASASATATSTPTTATVPVCYRDGAKPCNGHGTCERGFGELFYCECTDIYYSGDTCDVEHRSRGHAIASSVFTGWVGGDRFYLGYVVAGSIHLILGLVGCIGCGICVPMIRNTGETGPNLQFVAFLFIALCFTSTCLWWLADFIAICAGTLKDADGNKLV